MIIDKKTLCALIPHSGRMCLLDNVVEWNETSIACLSQSHLNADHPLRYKGRLSVLAGIEYGAQAMAVHGGLIAKQQLRNIPTGFLASVREANFLVQFIDTVQTPLRITARWLTGGSQSFMYEFQIEGDNQRLLSARVTAISQSNQKL